MKTITYNNILFTEIKDFEDYYVSRCGKVLSTKCNKLKLLKLNYTKKYILISLSNNKKIYSKSIHRLVALQFIPNLGHKAEVNHKDLDKYNNDISNLEWCTQKENIIHSLNNQQVNTGKHMAKRFGIKSNIYKLIAQYDLNGNFIKRYYGITEASRITGINRKSINDLCLKQKGRKTAGGFKWEYN